MKVINVVIVDKVGKVVEIVVCYGSDIEEDDVII